MMNKLKNINVYMLRRKTASTVTVLLRSLLIFGLCFLILQPLMSKISISFMTQQDLFDSTVINAPRNPTTENYIIAADLMSYGSVLFNSIWVSFAVALLQTAAATLVGYGFARFKFPLQKLLFGLVLLTIIIPPQTIMAPLYLSFSFFDVFGIFTALTGGPINMLNTVLPYFLLVAGCMGLKSGLYIYLLRQFFRSMPKELEEAAYVDGSNAFRTFATIMLPDALPMITSCFLFAFVWQWTDSFYATLFFRQVPLLSVAVAAISERFNGYWANTLGNAGLAPVSYSQVMTSTGTIMVIGPILLIYLFAQRGFVESVSKSGIKG
jgi:multiple sugar transport system permease protein